MTKKRLLAGLLALVMLLGLLPLSALAAPAGTDAIPATALAEDGVDLRQLVNIASDATVANSGLSSNQEYLDTTDEHLYDGIIDSPSSEYKWVNGGIQDYYEDKTFYPWVSLSFDEPRSVGGLRIYFEYDQNSDVQYTYKIWLKKGSDADYTQWGETFTSTKKSDGYIQTHIFDTMIDVTSIKIEFLGATPANSWIVLREVAVYGMAETLDLSSLTNIAKGMSPTLPNNDRVTDNSQNPKTNLTDDDNKTEFEMYGGALPTGTSTGPEDKQSYMDFDFGKNRSVGGFEFVVSESQQMVNDGNRFSYDIYGRADGAALWTAYAKNVTISHEAGENITRHPFMKLADLRYVRVILHTGSQWGAVSEFRIFGVVESDPGPNPHDGLIDLAQDPHTTIIVPSSEDGKPASNMIDGNLGTLWINDGAVWPADVTFALPHNYNVKLVEIDFEHKTDYPNRAMDVALSSAINGVTSDMSELRAPARHTMMETLVYTSPDDAGTSMSHLRITLSNPTNNGSDVGLFYPAIAEVKIWAVNEEVNLDDYEEITADSDRYTTASGDGYKEWDFHGNQQIIGFRVSGLDADTSLTLKGKAKQGEWTTYETELKNGDNVLSFFTGMSMVRVEGDSAQLDKLNLQIYGIYTQPPAQDTGSVAYEKPTHGSFRNATTYLVNDGNWTGNGWTPDMYPAYLDIDLQGNYDITDIEVYTPTEGYTEYTLYTSLNGRDFYLVDEKLDDAPCPATGIRHNITSSEHNTARYVRVYLEYYSAAEEPILNEVRVIGTESADQEDHTVTFQDVTAFEDTDYAKPITNDETIEAVQGIIERQVGAAYVDWFTFALANQSDGYDYFTLTNEDGRIKVTGNNGVSLATGVNHYLKYYCNVHISQVGNQVDMPDAIVPVEDGGVHKETKFPVRYAYNYCTHSYTMSFWNEEEWQNELDWQALNGVNVVLDITGQEEVWREFLTSVGYTHQEAKDFLAGPGYYAWAYMANLTGFGGPIHDNFLTSRVELARKNQRFMRALGMEPVLQAFNGMVPTDFGVRNPDAAIITQRNWSNFQRPYVIDPTSESYEKYANLFYASQKRVFGDAKYYAADFFHEGTVPNGLNLSAVASSTLDVLLDFNADAVWVIQAWQGNPSNDLLDGLRQGGPNHDQDWRSHALVLDLWAEHSPHNNQYGEDTDNDGIKEFSDTPWVWCMLNNFGGRMGLHGHLDSLQQNIPAAANRSQHMAGIGMSPEGAQENPVLYDFLFETIWTDDASQALKVIDLDQWLKNYVARRYGIQGDVESSSAYQAMRILADTVYKSSLNMNGQGAPESPINGRPSLSGGKASQWGNGTIAYDKTLLEQALILLLEDYDTLSASDAYLYDVADVLKQHLSNCADGAQKALAAAYTSGDPEAFAEAAENFLALIDMVDDVLGTRTEFTFGKWTGGAVKMAEGTDDFTNRLYLRNAKALVTTWGSKAQNGDLYDYSNRQWAGLTKDYYKYRWATWIDLAQDQLENDTATGSGPSIDWFPWEWAYARDQKPYSSEPNNLDLKELAEAVLSTYSVLDPLGPRDIDPATMEAKAGSAETSAELNPASNVLDRDTGTIWHTSWSSPPSANEKWIAVDLGQIKTIDGLRYLPRQDGSPNGIITGYTIYVSSDAAAWSDPTSDSWTAVVENGTWAENAAWKEAPFEPCDARYVKLLVTAGVGGFASAAEIRITAPDDIPVRDISLTPTTASVNVGSTTTLTATVLPANAADRSVTWRSSNESVATVADGVVTGVAEGTAIITVAVNSNPELTASCTVTVGTVNADTYSITVSAAGNGGSVAADKTVAEAGETVTLTVTLTAG